MSQPSAVLSPGGYVRQGQRNASPPRSVNVQVAVRCRPLNERERSHAERGILKCDESRREVLFNGGTSSSTSAPQSQQRKQLAGVNKKTYTYDDVFDERTSQAELYTRLVEPIVDEVLQGYNCTVFAYGQTGTGKTHTMEGGRGSGASDNDIDEDGSVVRKLPPHAGIIPRAISQIFSHLRSLTDEHSVRVSHLELYNEQLTDLLSPEDGELRVYEDQQRGTFVQGLDDTVVRSEQEIFSVLDKSAAKRKTAETAMNKFSSRSHSIFSITIHIKESTPDGQDLLKVGKLNLVDLAGSENVGRSGAVKGRAREAGNINQSLLTLGRVITALVDRHPHVPYRDSKLTRLLQESLGGRNKTCVIATVTPASGSVEETLSTLDYAYRAKSIKNRPTVNQMIAKHELLKEYTEEISKLKRELDATREKNGVYLSLEEYERLQKTTQNLSSSNTELETRVEESEKRATTLRAKLDKTVAVLERDQRALASTRVDLQNVKDELSVTQNDLSVTTQQRDENGLLVRTHVQTERSLRSQASQLQYSLKETLSDACALHDRVDAKTALEADNVAAHTQLQADVARIVAHALSKQATFREAHRAATTEMESKHGQAVKEVRAYLMEIETVVRTGSDDMNVMDERTAGELSTLRDRYAHDVQSRVHVIREGFEKNKVDRQKQHDCLVGTAGKVAALRDALLAAMASAQNAVRVHVDELLSRHDDAAETQNKALVELCDKAKANNVCQDDIIRKLRADDAMDAERERDALVEYKKRAVELMETLWDDVSAACMKRAAGRVAGNETYVKQIKERSEQLEGHVLQTRTVCEESMMKAKGDGGNVFNESVSDTVRIVQDTVAIPMVTEMQQAVDESDKMLLDESLQTAVLGHAADMADNTKEGLDSMFSTVGTAHEKRVQVMSSTVTAIGRSVEGTRQVESRFEDGNKKSLCDMQGNVNNAVDEMNVVLDSNIGKRIKEAVVATDMHSTLAPNRKEQPKIVDETLVQTRNHTSVVLESRAANGVCRDVDIDNFDHDVERTPCKRPEPTQVEETEDREESMLPEEGRGDEADGEEEWDEENVNIEDDNNLTTEIENDHTQEEVIVRSAAVAKKRKPVQQTVGCSSESRLASAVSRRRVRKANHHHHHHTIPPTTTNFDSGSESAASVRTDADEDTIGTAGTGTVTASAIPRSHTSENVLVDVSNKRMVARSRSAATRRIEPVIKKSSGIPAPRSRSQRRAQQQPQQPQ